MSRQAVASADPANDLMLAVPPEGMSGRSGANGVGEHRYPYLSPDGTLLYEVVRRPHKKFFQRRPDPNQGDRWIYDLDGVERVPYRLPRLLEFADSKQQPATIRALFVVEGEKDADRLYGLGLMSTTNAQGAGCDWPEEWARYFEGYEQAFVIADNDEPGRRHAQQVAGVVAQVVPDVRVVDLPGLDTGGDVSDFLDGVADDRDRLWRVCSEAPGWQSSSADNKPDEHNSSTRYEATAAGMFRTSSGSRGVNRFQLTNFIARVVADEEIDDGAERHRSFEIEARRSEGPLRRFVIPAERFNDVQRWASEQLGSKAIVYPGQSIAAHARVAIQELSTPDERQIFAHTGWRYIDGAWVYLHGRGAIGASGVVPGVEVRLSGTLAGYCLPDPPSGEDLATAVSSCLGLEKLAPLTVTVPLLGAAYRAALGPAEASVALVGSTGEGKSELAALAQQHFGADFHAKNLPGNWSSTANALGELAFTAKDALLVVDDFAPEGSRNDIDRLHQTAARLHRAQGNRAGRQRMRQDGSLHAERPPRGLVVSTGEEPPRGESVRARMLVVELPVGALQWEFLGAAQELGRKGVYAQALAGYLRWLAPRYGSELDGEALGATTARIRDELAVAGMSHRRTPDAIASLALGWRYFLKFAKDVGSISADERNQRWRAVVAALNDLAAAQRGHQAEVDPVRRFLEALRSALLSGEAHLTGLDDDQPETPTRWGWRSETTAGNAGLTFRPGGSRVGWVGGGHVFLDPAAAVGVAAQLAQRGGEPFPFTAPTLGKRLSEAGVLGERESARGVLTVRKSLGGVRRAVWSLCADAFFPVHENPPNLPSGYRELLS